MNQCITLRDFAELTKEEVKSLERSAQSFRPNDCQSFYKEVRSLESSVMQSYKVAVLLAKRTTDPNELSDIWKTASDICDSVLNLMKQLKDSKPECGTSQLYDLALDYKIAAFKRYENSLEDIQWKDQETPAGLFPKSS